MVTSAYSISTKKFLEEVHLINKPLRTTSNSQQIADPMFKEVSMS